MDRRGFLQTAGVAALPVADLDGAVNAIVGEGSRTATDAGAAAVDPPIDSIRYPLSFVPAIREPGERLRVELDVNSDVLPRAWLRPRVGEARPRIDLERLAVARGESSIWHDREVLVAEYAVPRLRGDVVEALYDLHVAWDDAVDVQHGAVDLVRRFPEDPTVAVLADPHAGDVFVVGAAAERSVEDGDPDDARRTAERTVGENPAADRWAAFRRAVAEVNLLDPDLVLTAGDYVQGQDVPGKYYQEYEDAHRILNELAVPAVTTPGNHDGYVQSGVDGLRLYERYFAPTHYSVDLRPDLHLVSANTYDWRALDRMGVSYGVSAWGGQVRDDQLAWLETDLQGWRAANPDGTILVVGHHSPTWLQDDRGETARETEGTPVAEQVARGVDSQFLQGGQMWHGANRLAFRDLLAAVDATLYVTGHSHRDRLARYHEGNVVRIETPGPSTFEPGRLHYVTRDGETDGSWSQAELAAILREPRHGPLFVETTTPSSGTGQYWGWRLLDVDLDGVDPGESGYPADEAFLDDHLVADRDGWQAAHADLGLYSYPSYQLDASVEASDDIVELELRSDLATAIEGAAVLSLAASPGVRVEGGRRVWHRHVGDRQDVKVAYTVPAAGTTTVTVETRGPTAGSMS